MIRPTRRRRAILLCLLAASGAANAANCELRSDDLQFGPYVSGSAAPLDSLTTVRVECSSAAPGEVVAFRIELGFGFGGSYATRSMVGADGALDYNLYLDSNRNIVWGDGSGGSAAVEGQLSLPGETLFERLVYGRIAPRQAVYPGLYVDTLVISLSY